MVIQKCVYIGLHQFRAQDFFSKCDQIRRKLLIWSHLLKKSLKENFIFCAVKFRKSKSKGWGNGGLEKLLGNHKFSKNTN